jgi:hypothetical protein
MKTVVVWRLAKIAWALGLAFVLVFVTFFNAWSLGGTFILPLLPGGYLSGAVHGILQGAGGANFYQVFFLVANLVFWSVVFHATLTILTLLRRGRMR